ncbi:hypothetical protein WALSEDRAFT_59843 [Wallemia mellicola CBS 633.66]|uniref:Uncharacterized protein n=1 Tax=Wallemia mellicola (strain ATCC MYA-4683 / CBS 633.66) TaxID=671144 RepID=I4YF43_WALMC|nr:hypothetical protein WALSEDRAFT_59843 [Wallemia mellicola CBS 633.66]EIM22585.1 hypothetical protein WALSEDRAFT_59843 [Wallemia mellicola CBS 633.66]|eukprot:XP_006957255.1 hypothetical protein WALSEDRAFT_59843 [Wallemia mellicola CBS 633.66]
MTRAALLPSSRPTIELFSKTERNDPTALYAHLLPSLLQTSLISTGVSLVSSGFLALLPPDSYFGLPVRFASIVVNLTQSLVMARLCAQYVGKDEETVQSHTRVGLNASKQSSKKKDGGLPVGSQSTQLSVLVWLKCSPRPKKLLNKGLRTCNRI